MIKNYIYTDKEKNEILKSMTFIFDSREQRNDHIKKYFDDHKIPYKNKKLNYGDYSFYVPKNESLGIMKDLSFSNEIVIEKKNSIDEIAQNISTDRARLEREFAICPAKIKLIIENNSYNDMITGNYKSQYKPKSLEGTLHAFQHRYNITFEFIKNKEDVPRYIYCYFFYYLRELLK